MALWGISTTTETEANNYALPKHLNDLDRNNTPWNCYATEQGWAYRRYGTSEQSGLSTTYYDEIIVPVAGLNTTPLGLNNTGLGAATPVAYFFEDPNQNSRLSIGAGATDHLGTDGSTGYVHVVWNECVFCSAGATILIEGVNAAGVATTSIVATAASVAPGASVPGFANTEGVTLFTNFNGQITNRVAFAFTSLQAGIGTILTISRRDGVVGTVTDFYDGGAATKTLTADLLRYVGGGGTTGAGAVGVGTTTLTLKA